MFQQCITAAAYSFSLFKLRVLPRWFVKLYFISASFQKEDDVFEISETAIAENQPSTLERISTPRSGERQADIRQFDRNEEEHDFELQDQRRIPWFNHLLQLVVMKFETLKNYKSLLKNVWKFVGKFNQSAAVTSILIQHCGRKLVGDVETRWNSTYIMINRYDFVTA